MGIGSLVGGGISAAGSLASASTSASAAKEAAKIQADASKYASDQSLTASREAQGLIKDIYDANVLRAQPFVDTGTSGTKNLTAAAGYLGAPLNSTVTNRVGNINLAVPDLLGSFDTYSKNYTNELDLKSPNRVLDVNTDVPNTIYSVNAKSPLPSNPTFAPTIENLEKTPGYQFTLDQGLKAVQNSYAAQGLGTSGAAMKGAADYAEGLASTTYQNQFKNWYDEQNLALDNYNKQTINLLQQAGAGSKFDLDKSKNQLDQASLASKFDLSQNQLLLDQATTSQNFDAKKVDQRLAATNDAENLYLKRYDQQLDQAKTAQNFDLANNQQQYSMLYDISKLGANAAAGLGTQGTTSGGQQANSLLSGTSQSNSYLTSGAAATAAGTVGSANAYSGLFNNLGGLGLTSGLLYDSKNGSSGNSLFDGLFGNNYSSGYGGGGPGNEFTTYNADDFSGGSAY